MNENQINEITQQVDGGITPTEVEYDEFTGANVYGTEPTTTLNGGQEELIDVEVEEVEQPSSVEMIEGEPMTDATGSGTEVNHALLYNREAANQHPIGAITGLSDRLKSIETVKRSYGKGSSYAEFRKWSDANPNGADRSGYFVYMVPNSETIDICDESREVYGVTTTDAAFVGNQVESDRSDDWAYAMVSLVGAVRVRTDGSARVGEYVVPNNYGEATLSENNYGYKVLSLGSYASYNYVVIALVPQNSALNKILGSLSGGEFELGDILLEIEGIKGTVNDAVNNSQIAIDTSNMTKGEIEDILGELENQKKQITTAQEVSQEAQEQAEAAKTAATSAQSSAVTAAQAAQSAKEAAEASVNQALSEVSSLKDKMQPLAEWSDPETGASGVVGFVAQANADHTTLATIVAGGDDDGSDLAAIKQTKDIIQHLVSHMDRYAVGEYSLSYGLSAEEAAEILTEEYIYVATSDHIEQMSKTAENGEIVTTTFTFKRGYAYTWNPEADTWTASTEPISTATEYKPGTAVGDLWYCWQPGITQTDENGEIITTYDAGTLYRWYGSEWIAVATMADNYQSRITSSVKQTADSLQSDVVALDGSVSTMRQDVDSITTLVGDDDGNVSSIIQRVRQIEFDIYNEKGTISSIQQQVTDNEASIDMINTGRFHVVYQSFLEVAPDSKGNKYSEPPMWNDMTQSFVFNDTYVDENGTYYFIDEDHTKYCCVTGESSYDIYTIGHQVTSMINSRVTDTESAIQTLTKFVDDFDENLQKTETITGLTQRADANEAEIDLVASRYDHIRLSVSTDEVPMHGTYKYTKPPTWNGSTGKYEFDIADRSDEGTYYMADEDGKTYCNVVTAADGTVLYETYGLAGGSVAALQQKVDENSASIGMVVDKDGVKGSAIIQAINGESTATINADKIDIEAALGGMTLSATNGEKSSTITLKYGETSVTSDNIQFTGDVVFKTDLEAEGATQIHGGNIIANTLKADFASIGGFKICETALYNNQTAYLGGTGDDGGDTGGGDTGGGDDSGDDEIVINAVALTLPETEGATLDSTAISVPSGANYSIENIDTLVVNGQDIESTQLAVGDVIGLIVILIAHDGYDFAENVIATVNGNSKSCTRTDTEHVRVAYTCTVSDSGSGGDEGGDDTGDTPSVALPTGYTQVEYIQSGSAQYIDTGVVPNQNTRVVMKAYCTAYQYGGAQAFYGTMNANGQSFITSVDGDGIVDVKFAGETKSFSAIVNTNTSLIVDHDGSTATVNEETQSFTTSTYTGETSIYLFALNFKNEATWVGTMKLYSCQIYDGENLVRDFVPCVNSSGVAGLYDTVSNEFYTNVDNTNFEAGPVVSDDGGEEPPEDSGILPTGYKQLEYIESTGIQYIDTGVVSDDNMSAEFTVQSLWADGNGTVGGALGRSQYFYIDLLSAWQNTLIVRHGATYITTDIPLDTNQHNVIFNSPNVSIDGKTFAVDGNGGGTNTCYLFGFNNNGAVTNCGGYKLYQMKMYSSGTLVRDFVPGINPDGVIGLYDMVNDVFYYNLGTGAFTAGPTVTTASVATFATRAVAMATVNPGVYLGIDGIGCGHGNFYVDNTGYLYANNVSISGNITATGGTIGGFDITDTYLSTNGKSSLYGGTGIYVGTDGISLGSEFYVTNTGYLYANSGVIGGVPIVNYTLQVRELYYDGKVTLSAVTDLLNNTETVKLYVGPTGYASRVVVQPNAGGYLGFFGSDGTGQQSLSLRNSTVSDIVQVLSNYGLVIAY